MPLPRRACSNHRTTNKSNHRGSDGRAAHYLLRRWPARCNRVRRGPHPPAVYRRRRCAEWANPFRGDRSRPTIAAGSESLALAEVIRSYSNVVLPDLSQLDEPEALTLEQQAGGESPVQLARDSNRPVVLRRLAAEDRLRVVAAYEQDVSLSAIARQVGISWDSVERILAEAGVRPSNRWRKHFGTRA